MKALIIRKVLPAVLAVAVLAIAAPSAASAATRTVGQTFAPDPATDCPGVTFLQMEVASGNLYTVPIDGTITSWSFQTGSDLPSTLKLKVGDPADDPGVLFVGEATAGALRPNAVNTYPANISVEEGDVIGFYMAGSGDCAVITNDLNDIFAQFLGDPPVGTAPQADDPAKVGFRFPVSATVNPDAATCKGKTATIVGTDGSDVRKGTSGKDVIVGLGGNDRLSGLAGNDLICGGAGKDTLKGGKGKDKLLGQKGKDTCKGGKGNDTASACEVEKSI
jgi:RTX calcium-binding nonapeptide repeat (4 copies)